MKKINHLFLFLISLTIFYFSLTTSGCDKLVENQPTINVLNLYATWNLTNVYGNLQDVCFYRLSNGTYVGENVLFSNNGVATLTCPGSAPITRNFSINGSALEYTTGVSYDITKLDSQLVLVGRNGVGRTLTYNKVITDRSSK